MIRDFILLIVLLFDISSLLNSFIALIYVTFFSSILSSRGDVLLLNISLDSISNVSDRDEIFILESEFQSISNLLSHRQDAKYRDI